MGRIAIINGETPQTILENLKKLEIEPLLLPLSERVDKPIAGHPDLQLFIYNNKAYCNPHIDKKFIKKLENKIEIVICETVLEKKYPGDIPYNIALVGKTAIHKIEDMEKKIKQDLIDAKIKLLNTNQGYSKCSTLIAGKKNIITPDKSINVAAKNNALESLLISPGHVDLPGYEYGFIGGASGFFENTLLLTGSLKEHPDYIKIMKFLDKQDIKPKFLSNNKIIDLGSIFVID